MCQDSIISIICVDFGIIGITGVMWCYWYYCFFMVLLAERFDTKNKLLKSALLLTLNSLHIQIGP